MTGVDHIRGATFHGRKGGLENRFRYSVDYVVLDPERATGPALFSLNRGNLASVRDADHGGAPGQGRGASWVRETLATEGAPGGDMILLLAQPRLLGHVFNPVSFWLCHDAGGDLRSVIAEVTNTYGERHSYLCSKPDGNPITRADTSTVADGFCFHGFVTSMEQFGQGGDPAIHFAMRESSRRPTMAFVVFVRPKSVAEPEP